MSALNTHTAGADTDAALDTAAGAAAGAAAHAAAHRDTITVPLHRLAHGRTGDKGDRSNISVIAWEPDFWPLLLEQITEAAVAGQFRHRQPTRVQRFVLPRLHAMNFVLDGVLDGGVNDALNLDTHGKCLSYHLLDVPVQVPAAWAPRLRGASPGAATPQR